MFGFLVASAIVNAAGQPSNTPDVSDLPPEYQQIVNSVQLSDDDRWACEVAMCMANPSGPTAVGECVPPIQKLHRELAKGNAFPKCPFVSNAGGGDGDGDGDGDDGGGGGGPRGPNNPETPIQIR
jgi:hypothetical protein